MTTTVPTAVEAAVIEEARELGGQADAATIIEHVRRRHGHSEGSTQRAIWDLVARKQLVLTDDRDLQLAE